MLHSAYLLVLTCVETCVVIVDVRTAASNCAFEIDTSKRVRCGTSRHLEMLRGMDTASLRAQNGAAHLVALYRQPFLYRCDGVGVQRYSMHDVVHRIKLPPLHIWHRYGKVEAPVCA